MAKRYKLILAVIFVSIGVFAQHLPDTSLTSDFQAQVKSLDEFQERFNGTESKPGIEINQEYRKKNILSLFDFNIKRDGLQPEEFQKKLNDFVDSVLVNDSKFSISNSGLVVECMCRMIYQGVEKHFNLIMQSEIMDNGLYRWAIVGVNGLEESGIISSSRLYPIDPIQHEVHFIGLHDSFNENPKHAFGYRSKNAKVNNLSVFLTLVYIGKLKFDIVERQIVHCFDIPGFVFSIEEITRKGENSGWLITSIDYANTEEKIYRLNKLLGNE